MMLYDLCMICAIVIMIIMHMIMLIIMIVIMIIMHIIMLIIMIVIMIIMHIIMQIVMIVIMIIMPIVLPRQVSLVVQAYLSSQSSIQPQTVRSLCNAVGSNACQRILHPAGDGGAPKAKRLDNAVIVWPLRLSEVRARGPWCRSGGRLRHAVVGS